MSYTNTIFNLRLLRALTDDFAASATLYFPIPRFPPIIWLQCVPQVDAAHASRLHILSIHCDHVVEEALDILPSSTSPVAQLVDHLLDLFEGNRSIDFEHSNFFG